MVEKQFTKIWTRLKTAPGLRGLFGGLFVMMDKLDGRLVEWRRRQYRRQRNSSARDLRVLVMAAKSGIGNMVESTPLIQAIRIRWPQARITVVTPGGDLLEDWSVPDECFSDLGRLKGRRFDHTFFPYWGWKGVPDVPLECERGQVHCPRLLHNQWFTKPEREVNMDMIRRLGYDGPAPPLYVSLMPPADWTFREPLRICILAGGRETQQWQAKRWPYYDQLCRMLLGKYPQAGIYFLGTEHDDFPESLKDVSGIYDLRGRFALRQTAWFLKQSDLAIGNDCGPMHIADAVQTPGLMLFGPTCELKNGPQYKVFSVRADLFCSPCQQRRRMETCMNPDCMKKLTAEEVMSLIPVPLLNDRGSGE